MIGYVIEEDSMGCIHKEYYGVNCVGGHVNLAF
jgi:hypothetical protein